MTSLARKTMPEKILVVDDDPDLLESLEANLRREGYEVITARNGRDGLARALQSAPDAILLDVAMPAPNGFEVCTDLRKRGIRIPILMLTARDSEAERVRGLDAGADDYIIKPFSTKELVARIRAVRRRYLGARERIREFAFKDTKIDFDHQTVTRRAKVIELSSCESNLLRLLVTRRGEAVSRNTILKEVWEYEFAPNTRTIDNHVVKLRQKIEDNPRHPKHILTAHGTGYKFVE